ncbi:hypothetical protein SDJN02_06580, partial [Cucurbita argyrosperma subsp. argyrosperma]
MANVSMPDMDSFSFLHVLLEMNIALSGSYVFSDELEGSYESIGRRSKPVSKDDLKYVWQHMYRRNINIAKLTHIANCVEKAKSGKESVGRPKLILKLMNEPCLTLRQVANHLQ